MAAASHISAMSFVALFKAYRSPAEADPSMRGVGTWLQDGLAAGSMVLAQQPDYRIARESLTPEAALRQVSGRLARAARTTMTHG